MLNAAGNGWAGIHDLMSTIQILYLFECNLIHRRFYSNSSCCHEAKSSAEDGVAGACLCVSMEADADGLCVECQGFVGWLLPSPRLAGLSAECSGGILFLQTFGKVDQILPIHAMPSRHHTEGYCFHSHQQNTGVGSECQPTIELCKCV